MNDKMSEDFLSRWSRRKREVAATENVAPKEDEVASAAAPAKQQDQPAEGAKPEFDPATLPPIDSITALSDIRDFLRAGVPPELTRAALRRAWSADPAIRDFVGLAENAWDFTDPNAMPGFGPLETTDEIRQMVAQMMSRVPEPGDLVSEPSVAAPPRHVEIAQIAPGDPKPTEVSADASSESLSSESDSAARETSRTVALQQEKDEPHTSDKKLLRRTHGGALPH